VKDYAAQYTEENALFGRLFALSERGRDDVAMRLIHALVRSEDGKIVADILSEVEANLEPKLSTEKSE
jgi:hypothetical protein